jgi:hypothetical protein
VLIVSTGRWDTKLKRVFSIMSIAFFVRPQKENASYNRLERAINRSDAAKLIKARAVEVDEGR